MAQKIIKKGPPGTAHLLGRDGRLYIRFSKKIFSQDKFLALGLSDIEDNYPNAKAVLAHIHADIFAGRFDFSLKSYVHDQRKSSDRLLDIWLEYLIAHRYRWKDRTFKYLSITIQKWINNDFSVSDCLIYRSWLLNKTTESMAKRVLTWVRASVKWWCEINQLSHTFSTPISGLKHNWEKYSQPRPFSDTEVCVILRNFIDSPYAFYLNFVKFLLKTGCRPSEAVGLKWKNIRGKHIEFRGSLSYTNGTEFVSDTSKNNRIRDFPITPAIQELLSAQLVEKDDFIFPKVTGGRINYEYFSRSAWKRCAVSVVKNSTPYNCRDTFISNQLSAGTPPAYIAKWCDTSIAMIEKFYFSVDDSFEPV